MKSDESYSGVITIPDNVIFDGKSYAVSNVYEGVFYQNTGITGVSLPNTLLRVKNNMFNGCSALSSVSIGNSVDSVGDNAFYGCYVLKSVSLPSTVKYLGTRAFMNCSALSTVTGESLISKINDETFSGSGLTTFTVPDSVKVIGKSAFTNCSKLVTVNFNAELLEINPMAFYSCSALTSATLPSKVNKIGDNAFYYCSSLITAIIPNKVTRIEINTFRSCSKLTSLTLGNELKYIGQSAFYECGKIASLTIPSKVDTLADWAFCSCSGIKVMNSFAVKPPVLGYLAFSGIGTTIPVYVPLASIDAYKSDTNWKSYFSNILQATIQDAVNYKVTSSKAPYTVEVSMYSAKSSGDIEIPAAVTFNNINYAVTGIADQAFEDYSAITSVKLPNSVKYIGVGAFRNCTSLSNITLSDSLTKVSSEAFYNTAWYNAQSGTTYLGKVLIDCKLSMIGAPFSTEVKKGTTLIADGAYDWCIRMTGIKIPNSLKRIGMGAFHMCGNLTSVELGDSITDIDINAFYACGFSTIKLPGTLKNINELAFSACANLGSLTLPASVSYIGNNAFKDCVSVDTITCMAQTPPTLGTTVFQNISKTIPLLVQPGCLSRYKAAAQWKDFMNLKEINTEIQQPKDETFCLYPNPVKESFCLRGLKGISTVYIYDMHGKTQLVKQVQPNEIIPITGLANGLFIVRIVNDSVTIKQKIIKE